jgi:hypothetical protein
MTHCGGSDFLGVAYATLCIFFRKHENDEVYRLQQTTAIQWRNYKFCFPCANLQYGSIASLPSIL